MSCGDILRLWLGAVLPGRCLPWLMRWQKKADERARAKRLSKLK